MHAGLIEYLSGFVQKRRIDCFDDVLLNRTRYIKVICEDIYQGHNASAILRTCDCFGIQDVHVIEARNSFEVNSEVALGASNWLSIHRQSDTSKNIDNIISDFKRNGYRIVATTPHPNGLTLKNFKPETGPFVLLFGTEKDGLSEKLMEKADEYLTIDMYGFTESFNVSVSAGIILHNLRNRLTDLDIDWRLNYSERLALKLDWLRKSIKRSDLIEKEFINKTGHKE